jgi:peptidoglycan hydrolase CwlO-like protein
MGIYRKYNGNFENELSNLSNKSSIVNSEIVKLEYIINGITSSWKDRTTDNFISNTNSKIQEMRKVEKSSVEEIENVLNQIHSLLDKYQAAS